MAAGGSKQQQQHGRMGKQAALQQQLNSRKSVTKERSQQTTLPSGEPLGGNAGGGVESRQWQWQVPAASSLGSGSV